MARFTRFYVTLIVISAVSFNSGFAQINPPEILTNALTCFNDKYIYSSCNEAYRLTQSGQLNVPADATDQFCNGPCLAETHLVLDCIDHSLTTFVFYNKATIDTIRLSLGSACGHSDERGHFNVDEYLQDYGYSTANLRVKPDSMITFVFIVSVLCIVFREVL